LADYTVLDARLATDKAGGSNAARASQLRNQEFGLAAALAQKHARRQRAPAT